jgi:eukaryotic-like serine/threonine-protein kinase
MDSERWRAVRAVFDDVVDLTPAARADRLAGADPELRRDVEALLSADVEAEEYLAGMMFGLPARADPLGLTGRTVSHFRVLELLGSGGMGVVYSAEDTRLNRPVALKLPFPQFQLEPSAKARFLNEARSAGALDHPSLCSIYEVGETADGLPFLAMALYRGQTLKARLMAEPRLTIAATLEIARQIVAGLAVAHQAGVVHRDLKPGNVMLLPDGGVKILDFGLAKVRDQSVTGPGMVLGTAAYMAPEQIRGDPVDGRADLWALGVLVYEMLTGRQPFRGEHEISVAHAILHTEPEPPSHLRSDIPAAVEDVVLTLLSKDPGRRYADADALGADLAAIQLGRPPSTPGRQAPRFRQAVRRGAILAAALSLIGAATALTLWLRGPVSAGSRGSVSHVLWVDDNPENNADVIRQLRSRGVEVTTALSTADALRRYDPAVHQLVISDLGRYEGAGNAYVDRAGLDLLTRLRARSARVKVAFCTTPRAAAAHAAEALSLGALEVFDDCGEVLRLVGF